MSMDRAELKHILETEVPLDELVIDSGIYEFHQVGTKSLGVSYEHNNNNDKVYIVNVFSADQYINVNGEYTNLYDCIPELLNVWNSI